MRYSINLVRDLRFAEKKERIKKSRMMLFSIACFGLLGLAIFYSTLQVVLMRSVIRQERLALKKVVRQYKKYRKTRMTVSKADVELLDRLQNRRIFWTQKLAAMAQHLPKSYWIKKFVYDGDKFSAEGFGYITDKQKQLIVLNNYFKALRADTTFNNHFQYTHFMSTIRRDEDKKKKIKFEFTSSNKETPYEKK